MNLEEIHQYYLDIDKSIRDAEAIMDMRDVGDLEEGDYESIYEDRYHCGVCAVRTVMEATWPAIEAYITALESELGIVLGGPDNQVPTTRSES